MSEQQPLPGRTRTILLWLVSGAFFMELLDGTILNTALPVMSQSFNQSPLRMQSVVIAYLLTVAFLIPISGWMSDRFGCRNVFFAATGLFALGSLFCAASPTLELLVLARFVQGIGGSMMVPVGRLIILRIFPRDQLIRGLTFITMPALVAPLIGPTLGGFLVQYASWHWIFLINIPLGILGLVLTFLYMPNLKEEQRKPFDWIGFLLFGSAMIAISLSLEGAGELHWRNDLTLALFCGGVGGFVFFWIFAGYKKAALFNTELFRVRSFAVGIVGNVFARMSNGSIPFLTPLMLQLGLGYSPLQSGMTLIPLSLFGIFGKSLISPMLNRFGHRNFLVVNTFLLGSLIAGFLFVSPETPYGFLLVYLAVLGMINSMQFTAMNVLTLTDLPRNLESNGNSLLSVVMQVSISMGIAISAMLLSWFSGHYQGARPQEMLPYFQSTFLVMGLIAVLSSGIFFFAPKKMRFLLDRSGKERV